MLKKDVCEACNQLPIKKMKVLPCCGAKLCSQCFRKKYHSQAKITICHRCKHKPQSDKTHENSQPKRKYTIFYFRTEHLKSPKSIKKIQDTGRECLEHKKPIEFICTVDKQLLCTHCAIFGGHRQHELKTFEDIEKQVKERISSMRQIQNMKKQADLKLKGKDFQDGVIQQLNRKKQILVSEIRQKYKRIYEQVKDAESKSYNDLVRAFRTINSQIGKMNKEKNQIEKQYNAWWKECQSFIAEVQRQKCLWEKASLFYEKSLTNVSQGIKTLHKFEDKNNSVKEKIIELINGIQVEYSTGLESQIYNHVQIKVNIRSSPHLSPRSPPKSITSSLAFDRETDEQEKSTSLIYSVKSPMSPKFNKTLPKKITSPKKYLSSPKSTRKEWEQTKHLDNLAFAERMLNEFKSSKETLDITGCNLSDEEILHVISTADEHKKIHSLKASKNRLTNFGMINLFSYLGNCANLNLSYNQLTEDILDEIIRLRSSMNRLKIINLTQNKIINEKKAKVKIQELKKIGVIVTI